MASQTEIANLSLRRFAQSRITDINENSPTAVVIRDVWENARRAALRSHHWNFAIRPAVLTASANMPLFKWRFAYPLPANYLRLVACNCVPCGTKVTAYEIKQGTAAPGDESSQRLSLYSNWSEAKIEYVADIPECELWDDQFVEAFSYKLAALVAPAIMNDGAQTAVTMLNGEFQSLLKAMSSDNIESKPYKVGALQGSAYQMVRCLPAEDALHVPGLWGLPLADNIEFNPWNVTP